MKVGGRLHGGVGWRLHGAASVSDTRVEHRVGAIDNQIDEHVDEREEQRQPLDDGIVACQHGFHHQPAQAGDVEYRFGHHHAADQKRDAQAHHRGDGHGGVTQRVAQQHAGFTQALGTGRADEVFAQDLDDTGARDARDQRHSQKPFSSGT
ncbi:hypothetical protein G6F65_019619 [Rhizopus arrhizus]|nr:hypothetical protein G6F65_019619 [Rhizopus arrhizus]